jgi:hypothetical protein
MNNKNELLIERYADLQVVHALAARKILHHGDTRDMNRLLELKIIVVEMLDIINELWEKRTLEI